MPRTDDLEKEERQQRLGRSAKLQKWETELRALAQQLWDEDTKNGWRVRYVYLGKPDRRWTALVTIGGIEFARFVRDEHGIIGVFAGAGKPQRFTNRHDAFDAAVKRRIAKQRPLG
jgi:hypothetical protein